MNQKHLFYGGAGLIFLLSFMLRWFSYHQTEFTNGWDSYFYLDQIKSYLETGHLHSNKISLLYPYLISIQSFTGDYVLTYKIGAILATSLFCFLSILLSYKISKNMLASVTVGVFFLFSPQLTYFGAQYIKNILGLVFFLLFIISIIDRKKIRILLFASLAILTHPLIGLLILVYGLLFFMITKGEYFMPRKFIGLLSVSLLWLFLYAGIYFTGLFSTELSTGLTFHPYRFYVQFNEEMNSLWKLEILVIGIIILGFFFFSRKNQLPILVLGGLLLFCLVPFFKWDLQGISLRLTFIVFLLGPFLLSAIKFHKKVLYVFISALSIASFWSWKCYNPLIHDPNYEFYSELSKRVNSEVKEINPELIIAHKSLAEYLSFELNRDVLPWDIPNEEVTENVWRIGYGLSQQNLIYYKTNGKSLAGEYFFIQETEWELLLNRIKTEDTELYMTINTWKNPSKVR